VLSLDASGAASCTQQKSTALCAIETMKRMLSLNPQLGGSGAEQGRARPHTPIVLRPTPTALEQLQFTSSSLFANAVRTIPSLVGPRPHPRKLERNKRGGAGLGGGEAQVGAGCTKCTSSVATRGPYRRV